MEEEKVDSASSYIVLLALGFMALFFMMFIGYLLNRLKSPFQYPYFEKVFDVSGKRLPNIEDYIDDFIMDGGLFDVQLHSNNVKEWKDKCREKVDHSILKKRRTRQFQAAINDDNMCVFILVRTQTRYRQINYVKQPYYVEQEIERFSCSYDYLLARDRKLRKIGYECTLSKYGTKQQRNLMMPKLRQEIISRDNYTCRICGKYMPDEEGLEIDHIVPVSKGGKTVPSNLQVLCSKCNRRKSNKTT